MSRAKTPRISKRNGNSTADVQSAPGIKKNVISINLEEEIRRRAYEIYEERGRIPGNEREDWLRAEREIRARNQQTA